MTDIYLEKLIEDMAEAYAEGNQDFHLCYDKYGDTTDYYSLYHAFIDGFKEGMNFKEGRK